MNDLKSKLDDYLEFDSSQLFSSEFNLARIFGGAIRDIIADQSIHDVDILCGSKTIGYIENVLSQNGYHFLKSLNGKDLQSMYSGIHIINEPHTWVKGNKIVQLIRPSLSFIKDIYNNDNYKIGFNRLIENVDLSCCGVSWDGRKLYEDYTNAVTHCKNRVFSINTKAWMYSKKRCDIRRFKLIDRGWKEVEDTIENNRDLKLDLIFNI